MVSPVKGRPVLCMVLLADGGTMTVHMGGRHPDYEAARYAGLRLAYGEPSPLWRDAELVEMVSIIQELEPDDLAYIPDLSDLGPGYASATT